MIPLVVPDQDKAAMDFEAQDDGVVAKILVKVGEGEDCKCFLGESPQQLLLLLLHE
jgi:Biotin-requiring enzyme